MSTLKKIFALTIAIAMVMSVAVFADFTDKSAINSKCVDDVNLLSAIGIINGYTDGTFKPEGTITRAEAAKMIYVLRNGGDDDGAASWKGAASFTDVPATAWYAGYVAYCAQYNIVAGRSATTFDPNANVTSLELAKMLLVVGGYRADVQGYTGSEWATNVRKDAESAGLLAGYGAALTTAAPRQWAAKMFANSIDAKMAVYYGDMLAVNTKDAMTVGENYLKLATDTTFVLANENWAIDDGATAAEGKTRFENPIAAAEDDFAVADDLVGKEVVVAYTVKNNKNVIIGVSETGKTAAGAITITKSGSENNRYTVEVGGTKLCSAVLATKANDVFDNAKVVYSSIAKGETLSEAKKNVGAAVNTVADAYNLIAVNSADQTSTAYDKDGDGDIDYIVINPVYYDEVSGDPTSTRFNTTFYSFDITDNDTKVKYASGLQDEDYVKIIPDYASGEIKIEKLTEVVVGVVSGTAGDNNEKYVIGGTPYETFSYTSALAANPNELYDNTDAILNKLGQSVTAYTDGKYIIFAEQTKESAATVTGKFAYIIDAYDSDAEGHTTGLIKIKALLSNGTVATMEFDTKASATEYLQTADLGNLTTGNIADVLVAGNVYEYATNSEGKIRLRKAPKETVDVDFTKIDNAVFDFDKQTIGAYGIDEGTYAFVKYNEKKGDTDASYKVVKASEFKNGMDGQKLTVYAHSTAKGTISAAIITVYDATAQGGLNPDGTLPGMTDTKVVFITSKMYYKAYDAEDEETKNYIQGIDIKTGATETYVIANANPADKIFQETTDTSDLRASFFELEPDGDEYVFTPVADAGWVIDSVSGVSSKAIQLKGKGVINSGDDEVKDVKVYVRNSNSGVSASSFSAITAAKNDAKNIMLHYDGTEIDIIVYASNASRDVDGYWY
ncbi:MAG: S-layer homology domain-containing protein [Clostridia bacterium]|nr:S-layer homology domain-containing protein [Clostridia bacterium]